LSHPFASSSQRDTNHASNTIAGQCCVKPKFDFLHSTTAIMALLEKPTSLKPHVYMHDFRRNLFLGCGCLTSGFVLKSRLVSGQVDAYHIDPVYESMTWCNLTSVNGVNLKADTYI